MPTLYDKYGGTPALKQLVRDFYKLARINPKVGRYFAKLDMEKLIDHQVEFLSFVMGKPVRSYLGNELSDAHKPLKISDEDFDEIAQLLIKSLHAAGLEAGDISLIVGVVSEVRDDIVSRQTPEPAKPKAAIKPGSAVPGTAVKAATRQPPAPATAKSPPLAPVMPMVPVVPAALVMPVVPVVAPEPPATTEAAAPASEAEAAASSTDINKQRKQIAGPIFGGLPKIKMIVRDLYSQVNEQPELRHYFLNVNPEKIIADQENFASYVLRKPDHSYMGTQLQSAALEIQVDAGVFSDIIDCLKDILRAAGLAEKDLPRLSTHIMEILEETRTQSNDNKIGILKPVDVSIDTLSQVYRRNKLETSIKAPDLVYAFASIPGALYPFPFFTQLDTENRTLTLSCQAPAKENASAEEMAELVSEARSYAPIIQFEARMEEPNPLFAAHYKLPYEFGIPSRLLIRIAQQFSKTFTETLVYDTEKILLKIDR